MGFANSLHQIRHGASPSHMWIELHRLVEASCRTLGRPFNDVFADLELRFGFSRAVCSRWPGIEVMQAAAEWMQTLREAHLTERRAWSAALRRAKAASDRHSVPAGLREAEARSRTYASTVPTVGYWGWKQKRERGR